MKRLLVLVLLLLGSRGRADEQWPVDRPWFTHVNFSFNVYTYNAAVGKTPSQQLTPDKRVMIGQQVGFGYYVQRYLRLQLTAQLGEAVHGLPPGTSPMSLAGIIPWVVFTMKGAFVGAGPLLAPRAFAKNDFEAGFFFAAGYAFTLPQHFTFAVSVQCPTTFLNRVSVQLSPSLSASYRF